MFQQVQYQYLIQNRLDALYEKMNRRQYVHPDPLEFLYDYHNQNEREIVGLVSSVLAYGKVGQILKSVSAVLKKMGPEPSLFLSDNNYDTMKMIFGGFTHRFATGDKMASFLTGAKTVIREYGSIEECFTSGLDKNDRTVFSGLCFLSEKIRQNCPICPGHLIPVARRMSACKRFNLYFRWMVRSDEVDPGGWDCRLSSKLIIPLDTHMHRISLQMGLTHRKAADMKTALEITRSFGNISSHDPVKYDFSLTRLGIRKEFRPEIFLNRN